MTITAPAPAAAAAAAAILSGADESAPDAHAALTLATIANTYQVEFENQHPRKSGAFAENVARACVTAGITRSGEPMTDIVDMIYLHVDAHGDWHSGAADIEPIGFYFRDYLAARLVEQGFYLDSSKA
jgi:hypothetical protein